MLENTIRYMTKLDSRIDSAFRHRERTRGERLVAIRSYLVAAQKEKRIKDLKALPDDVLLKRLIIEGGKDQHSVEAQELQAEWILRDNPLLEGVTDAAYKTALTIATRRQLLVLREDAAKHGGSRLLDICLEIECRYAVGMEPGRVLDRAERMASEALAAKDRQVVLGSRYVEA